MVRPTIAASSSQDPTAEDDGTLRLCSGQVVATEWTAEMQAQFEQLKKELTDALTTEIRGAEDRLSGQFKTAVEEVKGQVKLLGEAFGGTLDAIRRDIAEVNQNAQSTLELHRRILSEHTRDIESLKRRLPQ